MSHRASSGGPVRAAGDKRAPERDPAVLRGRVREPTQAGGGGCAVGGERYESAAVVSAERGGVPDAAVPYACIRGAVSSNAATNHAGQPEVWADRAEADA